jgi:hypothetical protein
VAGTLMPYFVTDSSPDCFGWATIKEDGEVIGCHTTKQEAIEQMVAISLAEEIEPGGERLKKKNKKVMYRVLPDNYRPSLTEDVPEGRACGNCIFYKEDDVKEFANGELRAWCEKWDDYVNGAYYCNAWQPAEEIEEELEDELDEDLEDELEEVREVNLTPPAYMRAAARRGLELNRQGFGGDGLTDKTKQEARDMADGRVSEDKWRRIAPWIARHLVDLNAPQNNNPDDPGYLGAGLVAHYLWGSGPSKRAAQRTLDYAQGVIDRLDAEEKRHGSHDQSSHGNWSSGGGEYSKGKDLLSNGTLSKGNKLDNDISEKASKFKPGEFADGKTSEDAALKELADRQGFSGQAQRATSKEQYDSIESPKIESGPLQGQNVLTQNELHRGFRDSGDKTVSAEQARNEFEGGTYWAGKGIMGNGIYAATNVDKAKKYSEGQTLDNILSFKLSPDAKIGSFHLLHSDLLMNKATDRSLPESVEFDVGRYAAALGFDGYVNDTSIGGGVFTSNASIDQLVILNRTAIILPPKG